MPWRKDTKSKEEYNAYYRAYYLKNREKMAAYKRQYNKEYREIFGNEYDKKWIRLNPHRNWCKRKLWAAKKEGIIKQTPCEVCGNEKSVSYHANLDKPLEVKWLCAYHHKMAREAAPKEED